ncbi:MAG: hypothetical protein MHPSP_004922, partial [Paramarteilia canceri]
LKSNTDSLLERNLFEQVKTRVCGRINTKVVTTLSYLEKRYSFKKNTMLQYCSKSQMIDFCEAAFSLLFRENETGEVSKDLRIISSENAILEDEFAAFEASKNVPKVMIGTIKDSNLEFELNGIINEQLKKLK